MSIVRRYTGWERLTWRHPEWWSVALSAAAWLLLAVMTDSPGGGQATPLHHHHGQSVTAPGRGIGTAWVTPAAGWLLMIAAMMVPMVLGSVRATAARSMWRRRSRAIAGFLLGYVGMWFIAGLLILALLDALELDKRFSSPALAAAGFAAAAAWQLTPVKRRALWSCHRTAPLAPRGWKADGDCIRYGWTIGGRCVVSCWALMLACLLAGHGLVPMGIVAVTGAGERYLKRPTPRGYALFLAGFALVYATFALG